jgi:hypothetical protein
MRLSALVSLASLASLVVVGCGVLAGCLPEPIACTQEARASVQVTVVDENGAVIPDATVVMQAAGRAEEPCESFGDASVFVCGFEISGPIAVRAEAPGRTPVERTVVVGETEDGCHVVTEQITIEL